MAVWGESEEGISLHVVGEGVSKETLALPSTLFLTVVSLRYHILGSSFFARTEIRMSVSL
jgi:hypothetical protein